ncbi:MAG: hypothetical protein UR12_C0012G0016 [candidate division TM6 bacterium GW2011_GWF2_30_66]|jgi:hypothetical protein|nr:MAG: hypothetical protein UR12_C0012G0016 [candidate division TM6 bacterium GW2011_GWF2_30_66]
MAINVKKIILVSITILNSTNLYSSIGCMDDSYHTKRKNDPKTYHYVKCNCPCHKYSASFVRGKCPQCGHYHDPKDFNPSSYEELKKKFNLDNAAIAKKALEKATSKKNNQVASLNKKTLEQIINN